MKLRELIEKHGFTVEDYNQTIEQLIAKGVGKGCYQDYQLLSFVIGIVLCDLDREAGE